MDKRNVVVIHPSIFYSSLFLISFNNVFEVLKKVPFLLSTSTGLFLINKWKIFFVFWKEKKITAQLLASKIKKKLRFQMRHLLKCVRMKGEKTSVNWVTCHRCIPALLVIPPWGTRPGSRWGSVSSVWSCELLPVSPKVHTRVAHLSSSFYFK